jgi:hypothetical protein
MLNNAPPAVPGTPIDPGDGFLMRQGYTVAWCGWQQDVPDVAGLMDRRAEPRAPRRPLLEGEVVAPNGGILRPFQKGQSGNAQGIYGGSAYHEARRICAMASPDAARKQVELMSDPDGRVAFMATEAVLRRGAGLPRDHSAEDEARNRINIKALSSEEQALLAKLLQEALGLE